MSTWCSKHVEAWNRLIIKFGASSWLIWRNKCPKHVEFYSKNQFEKLVHLVGFVIRIYRDARSPERQICVLVCCQFASYFYLQHNWMHTVMTVTNSDRCVHLSERSVAVKVLAWTRTSNLRSRYPGVRLLTPSTDVKIIGTSLRGMHWGKQSAGPSFPLSVAHRVFETSPFGAGIIIFNFSTPCI